MYCISLNDQLLYYYEFCRAMLRISAAYTVTFVYCVETAKYSTTVILGMRIGNRTQCFEWHQVA